MGGKPLRVETTSASGGATTPAAGAERALPLASAGGRASGPHVGHALPAGTEPLHAGH